MSPTGWFLGLFIDFSHGLPTQQLVGYRVILLGVNHLGGVNLYLTNKSGLLVPDIDNVSRIASIQFLFLESNELKALVFAFKVFYYFRY